MRQRLKIINEIIEDLMRLKDQDDFRLYAIEQNIKFFEAIKSISHYIRWLLVVAPHIDGTRLLELQDFPFPRWDREMHARLIEMERRNRPGLIKPLVDRIIKFIIDEQRTLTLVNFGCGGMEIERQVLRELLQRKYTTPILFIGVDKSSVVSDIAKNNLKEMDTAMRIYEVEKLTSDFLKKIKSEIVKHTIILCKNDILSFTQFFPSEEFDLIFHSLFMHHLSFEEKKNIMSAARISAKNIFEYDGYKSRFVFIPQTVVGWNHPPFFNAEIFSNLRFASKIEVRAYAKRNKLSFFNKTATYLLEYKDNYQY